MSKKFIVLDVEGNSTVRPYDIGYIVTDKNGTIYCKRSFAIPETIFENLQRCFAAKEICHKNVQEILRDVKNEKYKYISIEDFKKELLYDIISNEVKEIWAYNVVFDKSSLRRLFGEDWKLIESLISFYDIHTAITYTCLMNKEYIQWCKDNNYITEKKNIQTKAEIVYRFLFDNNDYEEEHTGLRDAEDELKILLKAIQSGKEFDKEKTTPPWKILKTFCESENIEVSD